MDFYFEKNGLNQIVGLLWFFTAILNTVLLFKWVFYQTHISVLIMILVLGIPMMYYYGYVYVFLHKRIYLQIVEDHLIVKNNFIFKPKIISFKEIKVLLKTDKKLGLGTVNGQMITIHLKLISKSQHKNVIRSLEQHLHT